MSHPLAANPDPKLLDAGPLGKIYATGVVTGLGLWQNSIFPGDRRWQADISNAQAFLNKTDGVVQYFVQAGAYSIPALGVPYIRTRDAIDAYFGPLPQGFLKLAPTANFSILAGKLPTLIGPEYTFSFENMNIQRGLLWNQENAVNRGVQVNYNSEHIAISASWNDGYYSNQYSWISLSTTWTINKANILAFTGGANTRNSTKATTATPVFENNQQIYDLIYTYNSGPWTVQPYVQYTHVPRIAGIGALHDASTYGAAILANYSFAAGSRLGRLKLDGFSLPGRLEYIGTTGTLGNGAPNLLYGPGSKAWSVTVTPTYQRNIFFARTEFSFVGAMDTTPGFALGPDGRKTHQARVVLEAGVLF